MIIVTGTKRSGTSMWMQILRAAGFPALGDAFPSDWGETIRDANEGGFYESPLRGGIYYATNPHPTSGAFLPPQASRRVVVKVFATGLAKSDLAYVDRVIASMRPWREYATSLERLYTMERENRRAKAEREGATDQLVDYEKLSPVLEWWRDNYVLVRDALVRRYPLHMISYASVLRSPEQVVGETIQWLGAGDAQKAIAAVREELRTQETRELENSGVTPEQEALFDELYAHIDERRPLTGALIDRLNDTHEVLGPRIAEAEEHSRSERLRALGRAKAARAAVRQD
ncbi:MAG TPA: hypothetical protein VFX59_19755 [Polyangiales bacterium]|nr:hypothetical protein [Polyangiales bacterium]